MATTYPDPVQLDSAAATLETLYTVPSNTQAVVSKLIACNRSATPTTIRVAVRIAGAAIDNKHYNYYDLPLPGNYTFEYLAGATLNEDTSVSVCDTLGNVSWSLYRSEIA